MIVGNLLASIPDIYNVLQQCLYIQIHFLKFNFAPVFLVNASNVENHCSNQTRCRGPEATLLHLLPYELLLSSFWAAFCTLKKNDVMLNRYCTVTIHSMWNNYKICFMIFRYSNTIKYNSRFFGCLPKDILDCLMASLTQRDRFI